MDIVASYLVSRIGLGFVYYGILLRIVCITCSRMIVLYSQYRVNQGRKMFVIFVYVTLFFVLLPFRVGYVLGVSQPVGRSPPCIPLHNTVRQLSEGGFQRSKNTLVRVPYEFPY